MELKNNEELLDLLPPLSQEDAERLKTSIQEEGVLCPILINSDGKIIDGHHRCRIAKELGLDNVPTEKMDTENPILTGVQLNLARRNMTPEQKREVIHKLRDRGHTQEEVAKVVGMSRQGIGYAEKGSNAKTGITSKPDLRMKLTNKSRKSIMERHPEETQEQIAADLGVSRRRIGQIIKEEQQRIEMERNKPLPMPPKKYQTVVVDPPWPIKKIPREVRPNQIEYDYPVMKIGEIRNLKMGDITEENCHLYLWTTQKYLPIAFEILEGWGFGYIFTMVWHKTGGYQPQGLPQYNCEFVLFGRKGRLDFLDTKDFPCCFVGKRRGHSRKPIEFYDTVRRVSPGPRIDMFSREKIEGFDQYGNEVS